MKVIVASSIVPLLRGGGLQIAHELVDALRERGHETDTLLLPHITDPDIVTDQLLAMRLLDVADAGDRLIAIRPPAHLLRHPSKVLWMIHQDRGYYDLWGTLMGAPHRTAQDHRRRDAVIAADDAALPEAQAIYTNSRIVGDRLRAFNGLESQVLYPPLGNPTGYRCDEYGDYVLYVSRIAMAKRQHLLAEAMAHVRSGVRLVLAGGPDSPGDLERLQETIAREGVADRVTLLSRWISEEEKRDLIAGALACAYLPFEEDSYGYPSLESYQSRKPVLTCTDSGGTHELVVDGETGVVAEPDPVSIAAGIDRFANDRAATQRMGELGHERANALITSWDDVVGALLS
jgi:glycosyltransferase involved in cell wall biosynthesis